MGWKFASDPHDLVIRQLIATVRPYHRLLAVFETLATKTPKNRRRHEHERYVSRHLHWEQKQPSHDSLECPFRGDPPQQDARWDRGLESMGRKASDCNRRHGWPARQDQKGKRARHRGHKQSSEWLYGCSRGFA